jgi:hypothetical protein
LYLDDNRLTHFPDKIFKNLNKLEYLRTHGNSATTRNVDFSGNPNFNLYNETYNKPYRQG